MHIFYEIPALRLAFLCLCRSIFHPW